MRSLLFILLALNLTCVHTEHLEYEDKSIKKMCMPPVIVAVSDRWPEDWMEPTRQGVEYWNEAVGKELFTWAGRAPFNSNDLHISSMVLIDTPNADIMACGYAASLDSPVVHGKCIIGGNIMINPECVEKSTPERLNTLIRHETGHILGLGHIKKRENDVMWETLKTDSRIQHPRPAHRKQIRSLKKLYK